MRGHVGEGEINVWWWGLKRAPGEGKHQGTSPRLLSDTVTKSGENAAFSTGMAL